MDAFRLDRQAKIFLAVLIVVALALIPLAPFASMAFGALALVVLGVVFLIALARNRRLFGPLTPAEGALVFSSAIFALGGALVVAYAILMLGTGNAMLLSHAMLPFSFSADGPRPQEHNAIADDISRKLRDGPFPNGRQTRFADPATQKAFADWLTARGVRHETVKQHGEDWIFWDGGENLAHEFMTSRSPTACKDGKKTAQAPGTAKCS